MQCQNSNCGALDDLQEKCTSCGNCQLCGKVLYDDCRKCTASTRDNCDCCQCECCDSCDLPYLSKEDYQRLGNPTDCANNLLKDKCNCCDQCKSCCECVVCCYCDKRQLSSESNICSECDRCERCCNCSVCEGCDARNVDICGECSYCENCCNCFNCSSCGPTGASICGQCEYCENCCSCDDLEWVKPVPGTWHGRSGRYLGVEIEVDDGDRDQVCKIVRKWGAGLVRDGSLSSSGFEVTTAPARGKAFTEQLIEICSALKAGRAVINRNCGLHVHVDARDLKFYEIRRVAKYYAAIEPALYAILPEWRRSSHYCLPSGHRFHNLTVERHKKLRQAIHMACYQTATLDRELSSRKKQKYDEVRYAGLNLHSWFYRGTVEFRHFGGSGNVEKITCWARLCCAIIEFAAQSRDFEIDQLDPFKSAKNLEKAMNMAGEDVSKWVEGRWEENMPNIRTVKSMAEVR